LEERLQDFNRWEILRKISRWGIKVAIETFIGSGRREGGIRTELVHVLTERKR